MKIGGDYLGYPNMEPLEFINTRLSGFGRMYRPEPIKAVKTQGRNERCKCGSGKKFKMCCIAK